jgi:hypothetical protein
MQFAIMLEHLKHDTKPTVFNYQAASFMSAIIFLLLAPSLPRLQEMAYSVHHLLLLVFLQMYHQVHPMNSLHSLYPLSLNVGN